MREDVRENFLVRAIASDTNVAKVALLGVPDVPGMAAKVFEALSSGSQRRDDNTKRDERTDK